MPDESAEQDQFMDRWKQAQHAELARQRRRDAQEPSSDNREKDLTALIDARVAAGIAAAIGKLTIKNGQNITFTGSGFNITGSVTLPPVPPLQPTLGTGGQTGETSPAYVMEGGPSDEAKTDSWLRTSPPADTFGVIYAGPRTIIASASDTAYSINVYSRDMWFDSFGYLYAISAETLTASALVAKAP